MKGKKKKSALGKAKWTAAKKRKPQQSAHKPAGKKQATNKNPMPKKPLNPILLPNKQSKDFNVCNEHYQKSQHFLKESKIAEAKLEYKKSLEAYLGLEYHEKKEMYGKLIQLYNSLMKS